MDDSALNGRSTAHLLPLGWEITDEGTENCKSQKLVGIYDGAVFAGHDKAVR